MRDAFAFNVATAHALTTAAVPLMLKHAGGGSIIINITSTMGRVAGRGFAAYGTAKAALAHYTRLSALDLCLPTFPVPMAASFGGSLDETPMLLQPGVLSLASGSVVRQLAAGLDLELD